MSQVLQMLILLVVVIMVVGFLLQLAIDDAASKIIKAIRETQGGE